jgi:hypothetical protein
MREKFVALLSLLAVVGLLAGCVIEPAGDGYRRHHHHDDRD